MRLKWLKWILINGWRNAASPVSHAKYVSLIQRFWDFSIFWGVPKIQQMIPFSSNNSSSTHTPPHSRLWLQHHHGAPSSPPRTVAPDPDGLCKRHMCNRKSTISIPAPAGQAPCCPVFCRWVVPKQWPQATKNYCRSTSRIGHVRLRFVSVFLWILTGLFHSWYM